jgi:GrpB-like predicted nucleotidyltransferase (UPF0157 family)
VPGPVGVVDHDPSWPVTSNRLGSRVLVALGDLTPGLGHVGATSVPGCAAEAISDPDLAGGTEGDVRASIELLFPIGCVYRGVRGRQALAAHRRPASPPLLGNAG